MFYLDRRKEIRRFVLHLPKVKFKELFEEISNVFFFSSLLFFMLSIRITLHLTRNMKDPII